MVEIVGLEKKLSLEEQPGSRATTFGESDADLAHLVHFHCRNGPGQALPFDLIADHRRAANLVGDKATQVQLAFGTFQFQAIEGSDGRQFGIALEDEIAEEAQVLAAGRGLAEYLAEDWLVGCTSRPARDTGAGSGGTVTRSRLAAQGRLVPCSSRETSTIKKATLKNSWAFGRPAISGNTARMIGTAPRRPTQAIKARSRSWKARNGSRPIKIDSGRANRIIHSARPRAGRAIGNSSWGVTSRPRTRNIPICASQARPSSICRMPWRERIGL